MSIEFKPTYLYIKQHSITGKCYFGKTVNKDPIKYPGSGTYWKAHIKIHGRKFVETLWFKLFTDRDELIKIATLFSEQQDIVKSDRWLNLVPENGMDGNTKGMPGKKHSEETKLRLSKINTGKQYSEEVKDKLSKMRKGMKKSPEHVEKVAAANRGRKCTEEQKAKFSAKMKGRKLSCETRARMSEVRKGSPRPQKIVACPNCFKEGAFNLMTRYHFDNCKNLCITKSEK